MTGELSPLAFAPGRRAANWRGVYIYTYRRTVVRGRLAVVWQQHLAHLGSRPKMGERWAGRTQAGRDFPVAQPTSGPACRWPSLFSPSPPLAQPALAQPPQAARPAGWARTGWASCGLGEPRLGHLQAGPLLGWATSGLGHRRLGQMLLPDHVPPLGGACRAWRCRARGRAASRCRLSQPALASLLQAGQAGGAASLFAAAAVAHTARDGGRPGQPGAAAYRHLRSPKRLTLHRFVAVSLTGRRMLGDAELRAASLSERAVVGVHMWTSSVPSSRRTTPLRPGVGQERDRPGGS